MVAPTARAGAIIVPISRVQSLPVGISIPVVELVDIRLPPEIAVYHLTSIRNVPVCWLSGTFTYADTAYEAAVVTAMREDTTTPELAEAALVISKQEEPKKASVVIRAIVEDPVTDHPVVSVLKEGLVTRLTLDIL